jgi:hypothetical protein
MISIWELVNEREVMSFTGKVEKGVTSCNSVLGNRIGIVHFTD